MWWKWRADKYDTDQSDSLLVIVVITKKVDMVALDWPASWDSTVGEEGVKFLIKENSELLQKYIVKIGSTHYLTICSWPQMAIFWQRVCGGGNSRSCLGAEIFTLVWREIICCRKKVVSCFKTMRAAWFCCYQSGGAIGINHLVWGGEIWVNKRMMHNIEIEDTYIHPIKIWQILIFVYPIMRIFILNPT